MIEPEFKSDRNDDSQLNNDQEINSFSDSISEKYTNGFVALDQAAASLKEADDLARARGLVPSQEEVFRDYYSSGNIVRHPASPDEKLDDVDIVNRLEVDHVVKTLKYFDEIASRQNLMGESFEPNFYDSCDRNTPITYISGQRQSLEHRTSRPEWADLRCTIPEQRAIDETWNFLNLAAKSDDLSSRSREIAKALLQDLSYIGEAELDEAARGLALFWKKILISNPDKSLHVATGVIS